MNDLSWAPPGPLPPQPAPPPAFSGNRKAFLALVARGAGLEFVTIGFYRFWLATDIRRHLWSNTLVDGDALEYTGRGKELLIGFLVALAILVPIYLGYFIIGIEVEHAKAFTSLPMVAFFYLFSQFAIYRARRYRLTRTVWCGVRFWMSGSGWIYALKATLWGLLAVVTLGVALPWRAAALERYKMCHSYYGDLQGSFEGRGWELFKQAWWLWLLILVALFLFAPLALFPYAAFKAVEWRWWLSGIRFGGVRLESTLSRGALVALYWKVVGWIVLLVAALVIYLVLCAVLIASMSGESVIEFFRTEEFTQSIPLFVLAGIGYLVFVLSANVVIRLYLMRDLWVLMLTSVTVHNIAAAADVAARGEPASALGEGLADGLDVGGF